jgi:chromosomal replication initiation ATPase DnaA
MAHQPSPEPEAFLGAGFSDRIIADVAQRHGLRVSDLIGRCQIKHVAHARQEAMALIYATGRVSTPWIGRKFKRDHTTVLHAIDAHKRRAGIA